MLALEIYASNRPYLAIQTYIMDGLIKEIIK